MDGARLLLNISAADFSPAVPSGEGPFQQFMPPLPAGVDPSGRLLLYLLAPATGQLQCWVFNASTGAALPSFGLPMSGGLLYSDMDVHGVLCLLWSRDGHTADVMLTGVTASGSQVYSFKPDLSSLPDQYLASLTVDAAGIAYITVVNVPAVFTFDTRTNTLGRTLETGLASNYIAPLLSVYNASLLLVAHPEQGCIEQIDISQSSAPPAAHQPLSSPAAALLNPVRVLYSTKTTALLVTTFNMLGQTMHGIDRVNGSQRFSFPVPSCAQYNFAQDASGLLYGVCAGGGVQLLDPSTGSTQLLTIALPDTAVGIAYDELNNTLTLAAAGQPGQSDILAVIALQRLAAVSHPAA